VSAVPATFRSMGCDVVVAGAGGPQLAAIRRLFCDRDQMFSRFRPESELCAVNRAAGVPTLVSPRFAAMLSCALAVARRTDGLVDPTVGRSLTALGYDRDFADLGDDPAPPRAVSAAPGWRSVELTGRLLRIPPGCELDLNGVVKSSAVDEAAALLPVDGYVSAGGDLAVRGPADVALPAGGAVRVVQGGIATAGMTRRRWRRGGRDCHHLIDPATGLPADSPWREVTASGASCLDADVAARAALLRGGTGPEWLDRLGVPGRFVAHDGGVLTNPTWAAMTAEPACI
jgi:thiamine biosynthesis lipoprotein ApbE